MYLLAASQVESAPSAVPPNVSEVAATAGAAAGAVFGLVAVSLTTILLIMLAWWVLQIIADWKIFTKAGQSGWKSIIPILNTYVEYDICWNGVIGLLFLVASFLFSFMSPGEGAPVWKTVIAVVCGIVAVVLHLLQSIKLSKAFGHSIGLGLVLFFFGPIGRLILGFGGSEYIGRPD